MMKRETKHWLLLLIGLMAWFGVITDFTTAINKDLAAGLLVSDTLIRLFGYYTILTNIFVAIVATICVLFPASRWGCFLHHRKYSAVLYPQLSLWALFFISCSVIFIIQMALKRWLITSITISRLWRCCFAG